MCRTQGSNRRLFHALRACLAFSSASPQNLAEFPCLSCPCDAFASLTSGLRPARTHAMPSPHALLAFDLFHFLARMPYRCHAPVRAHAMPSPRALLSRLPCLRPARVNTHDLKNERWWLLYTSALTQIDFWPPELFTGLKGFASKTAWRGEVFSS
ncbi:hypothetical protein RND71_042589 [Anisodus tanguticus]|uniref:Neprosin PEP catalytic domain-containing protein n=1 Tax=Anisodus tanguticus TaxID=243964 RepID=A0AAE1QTZ4_9SOLA|nr:hypothetical protein RND71_042589 [Anisodus tanguticus]